MQLTVTIDIRPDYNRPEEGYGNFTMREDFRLEGLSSFAEVAKVIGQFHDVALKIQERK